jgi:hypothetical protein
MPVISFSLTKEEKERFEVIALALGVSKSELFRRILQHWAGEHIRTTRKEPSNDGATKKRS